ncbi:MAG: alpha-ketoglutarate-dependent dioxygenase AlkB, partial [Halomonas sp.]|nr:alpha-ketoglutarate-dependent dioxygenase AlkB [Halomonas sp.]
MPTETLLPDPPLWLAAPLLGEPAAARLLAILDAELPWQRPTLRLYGREHSIPRSQVWMGDLEASYRYSGRDFHPEPWHPAVADLRDRVVNALPTVGVAGRFNSVLLNRYANGEEKMGWHSD